MARPAARRLAMMEKGLLATALVAMRAATAADIFEVEVKRVVCIYKMEVYTSRSVVVIGLVRGVPFTED
jgi:hypothetical protein